MGITGTRHTVDYRRELVAIVALFLMLVVTVAGAETRSWIKVSPQTPEAGKLFVLEINVSGWYGETYRVVEPSLNSSLRIVKGPLPVELPEEGRLLVRYTMRARRSGTYILGAFLIKIDNSGFFTGPLTLEIVAPGHVASQRREQSVLEWVLPEEEVREGQTVVVRLQLRTEGTLRMPEDVTVSPPANALFEEVQGRWPVTDDASSGSVTYSVPLRTYLLTPTRAGNLFVPAAVARFADGSQMKSTTVKVVVKKLPVQARGITAIGSFSYTARLDQLPEEAGAVEVRLRVWGTGNLPLVKVPALDVSGVSDVRPAERTDIDATDSGYQGSVEVVYTFRPPEGEAMVLVPQEFSFFRPGDDRVFRIDPGPITISAAALATVGEMETPRVWTAEPLSSEQARRYRVQRFHRKPAVYLLFAPGPLFVGAVLLRRRLRRPRYGAIGAVFLLIFMPWGGLRGGESPDGAFDRGVAEFQRGQYTQALASFAEAKGKGAGGTAGLLYNVALCHHHLGSRGLAVHYLRAALRAFPGDAVFREALSGLEGFYDLRNQANPPPRLDPAALLIVTMVLANAAAALFGVGLLANRVDVFILAVLAGLAAAAVGSVLGVACVLAGRPVGTVITTEAAMSKIPHPEGEQWRTVPEGSSLYLSARFQGYVVATTAQGLRGWIREEQLIALDQRRDRGYRSR